MKHNVSDLGELEREVLHLVWDHGPSTADWVQKALSRPLKESTIRTVLKRLEAKGHLTHSVDSRTFVYQAADTRGPTFLSAAKGLRCAPSCMNSSAASMPTPRTSPTMAWPANLAFNVDWK